MSDKLCGFNYLVYGLEGADGGGLYVFIQYRNEKTYLINIYLISPFNNMHLALWKYTAEKAMKSSFLFLQIEFEFIWLFLVQ